MGGGDDCDNPIITTLAPTPSPTSYPTPAPTSNPTTRVPTSNPIPSPTESTSNPSFDPTPYPTSNPTPSPTSNPSLFPSKNATKSPTIITINPSTPPPVVSLKVAVPTENFKGDVSEVGKLQKQHLALTKYNLKKNKSLILEFLLLFL